MNNETEIDGISDEFTDELHEASGVFEKSVEEHATETAGAALIAAIVIGVAIGFIVRALRPAPTPRERVLQVIEDLEDRLRDKTRPALRKASSLAKDGASLFNDGLHSGGAKLETLVTDIRRLARNLLH